MAFADEFVQGFTSGRNALMQKRQMEMEETARKEDVDYRERRFKQELKQADLDAAVKKIGIQQALLDLMKGQKKPVQEETMPEGVAGPPAMVPAQVPPVEFDMSMFGGGKVPVAPTFMEDIQAQKEAEMRSGLRIGRQESMETVPETIAKIIGLPVGQPQTPKVLDVATKVYGEKEANKRSAQAASQRGIPGGTQMIQLPSGQITPYFPEIGAYRDPTTGALISGAPPAGTVLASTKLGETAQTTLAGFKTDIENLQQVSSKIKETESLFGPVVGRFKNVAVNKLGGVGASEEERELSVRMRALVRDKAFSEGGKQLTPTEKEEWTATYPRESNTVGQALINARLADEFLRRKAQNRIQALSPLERNLVDPGLTSLLGMGKKPARTIMIGGKTVTVEEE
jgi:hypothetical protein